MLNITAACRFKVKRNLIVSHVLMLDARILLFIFFKFILKGLIGILLFPHWFPHRAEFCF